jgi:hypothetical protein
MRDLTKKAAGVESGDREQKAIASGFLHGGDGRFVREAGVVLAGGTFGATWGFVAQRAQPGRPPARGALRVDSCGKESYVW